MSDLTLNQKKVILAALRSYRQEIEEDTGYLSDQECSEILNVIDSLKPELGRLMYGRISEMTIDPNPLNGEIESAA